MFHCERCFKEVPFSRPFGFAWKYLCSQCFFQVCLIFVERECYEDEAEASSSKEIQEAFF